MASALPALFEKLSLSSKQPKEPEKEVIILPTSYEGRRIDLVNGNLLQTELDCLPTQKIVRTVIIRNRGDKELDFSPLQKMPKLRHLVVDDHVTQKQLAQITGCTGLYSLIINVEKTAFTDDDTRLILNLQSLDTLVINSEHFTNKALEQLSKCERLEKLIITGGKRSFTDDGVKHLAKLRFLSTLGVCNEEVNRHGFTDQAIRHLQKLPLKHLAINGCLSLKISATLQAIPTLTRFFTSTEPSLREELQIACKKEIPHVDLDFDASKTGFIEIFFN